MSFETANRILCDVVSGSDHECENIRRRILQLLGTHVPTDEKFIGQALNKMSGNNGSEIQKFENFMLETDRFAKGRQVSGWALL